MNEKRYIISDASKMLDVESHVLRYWEEELEIVIPRNEMGHRYYTEQHINLLRNVRDLKRQGYGLRTIRMMLGGEPRELPEATSHASKMEQFQEIMGSIVTKALRESGQLIGKEMSQQIRNELSEELSRDISGKVSQNIIKDMDEKNKIREKKEEERYKRLDAAIRMHQERAKKEKVKPKKEKKKSNFQLFRKEKQPQTT